MSINSLRFANNYDLYMNSINLGGVNEFGNLVAPIITNSNVLCANVYVERAQYVDGTIGGNIAGNSAVISGTVTATQYISTTTTLAPLVVASDTEVANLRSEFSDTANVALALKTTGANVVLSSAAPPIVGQVLIATSNIAAEWGNAVISTANVTVDNLVVNNSITFGSVNFTAPLSNVTVNNITVNNDLVVQTTDLVANLYAQTANIANSLKTTGAPVLVEGSAPPGGAGYVLQSVSATEAEWTVLSGTGIGSLNALTANVQTFATGTSGTALNIVSGGSVHTFNLPIAGSSVTSGTISNTSQTIAGVKTFNDGIVIPAGQVLNGVASSANALNSLTTTVNVSNSAAPVAGQYLVATSNVAAEWQTLSIASGNLSVNVLTANSAVIVNDTSVGGDMTITGTDTADRFIATCSSPTAPIYTTSTAECANLRAQLATTAYGLKSASTTVAVSPATAPSSGQVLTATSSTNATWQAVGNSTSTNGLKSATTTVGVSGSAAPAANYLLQATSSTAAVWVDPTALTGPVMMVRTQVTNLTSANIKALGGAPVTIVSAAGSGKAIIPFMAYIEYNAGATPYINGAQVVFGGVQGSKRVDETIFTSATDRVAYVQFGASYNVDDDVFPVNPSSYNNVDMTITTTSGTNFTVGDGTARVTVWYTTLNLLL